MKARLILYEGSPKSDPFGTYLYLDLSIERFDQITLAETERLDDLSDMVVIQEVEKIINKASIFARSLSLNVSVNMEEITTMCVELDCTDETSKEIRGLIRNFIKDMKGEL